MKPSIAIDFALLPSLALAASASFDYHQVLERQPVKPKKSAPPLRNDSDHYSPFPPLDYLATLPRPALGSVPYGEVITSCSVPGTVALTFDDGPWKYTWDLLDLLEYENVRATFFVCGGNMAEDDQLTGHGSPRALRRMLASGHQVGTHTWAHPDLATLGENETLRQLWLNEQALAGVLGMLPTYFRPPYISWTPATLNILDELGYHVISLDVDTNDWRGDYDAARENYVDGLESGDPRYSSHLVLAHDIWDRTVHELAEFMIYEARKRGYTLVTLGECLGDDRRNWYRNPYDGRSWAT